MHQRKADVVHVGQHKYFLKGTDKSEVSRRVGLTTRVGTEERKDEAESHRDRRRRDNQEMDGAMEGGVREAAMEGGVREAAMEGGVWEAAMQGGARAAAMEGAAAAQAMEGRAGPQARAARAGPAT